MSILSRLRRWATKRRDRKTRPGEQLFLREAARLGPGDVALDCGANVGKFTLPLARSGARVYAFEPHPAACAELRRRTREYANVTVFQAAVTAEPGAVLLYHHRWDERDAIHWSTGSSLVEGKRNVRSDRHTEVEGIDLAGFIREYGLQRIRLLKMDIEGAEVDVLNRLLDEGLHTRIDLAFIELHDRQIRELAGPTQRLRERLEGMESHPFRLDWR